MWGPSLIYEYRPTEFTRQAQWRCCHHRHFVKDSHNIIICTQNRRCGVTGVWLDTLSRQRGTPNRFLIIISIISGMLLCCKNLSVLLWGPLFCGGPLFGRTCWTCLNPPLCVLLVHSEVSDSKFRYIVDYEPPMEKHKDTNIISNY